MSTDSRNVDQLFEVLSHQYRRHLLVDLSREGNPQTEVESLSERLATDSETEAVRVQLVHCHLPKLDRYGFVEWDRTAETVSKGPKWVAVEPFLGLLISHDSDLAAERA